MALLDELADTPAEDDPRRSALAGPAVLRPEHLRAMERALERELPSYTARVPEEPQQAPAPEPAPAPALPVPASAAAPAPLPVWVPPTFEPVEPLPVWTPPPVLRRPAAGQPASAGPRASALDPCPSCGEEVAVTRLDLTANASRMTCRACGLQWDGDIEPLPVWTPPPLALPAGNGERGQVAAG